MSGRRGALRLTAALLLVGAGCGGGRGKAGQVPTTVVAKTRFARTVDADGHLKPVQATIITAPRSAEGPMRVAWLIEDGATVAKDDVIARFDDSDLKSKLLASEADKATAEAKKQKEALMVAQARNDRQRTSEAAVRELELGRTFARKDVELYSRDDIVTSEIDGRLQEAKATHAQQAQTVDGQVARRKLQILEVEARKADQAIARAKDSLEKLEARAPHAGVVVFKRSWRGETIAVGDQAWGPLAEVSRSDELEAEVFVLEVEAAGLAKGKKAEVVLESQPGVTWAAEIGRVESVAKRRNPRSPTQYFGVTLKLEKTDAAAMKPGARVRARLLLDEREALVVPRPALFQKDGGWIAYRRRGGGFEAVSVTLGASTAGLVAVEAGLAPGDEIALRDPGQSLEDLLSAPGTGTGAKGP
jgi:RND family efflux transporter MFP subunit